MINTTAPVPPIQHDPAFVAAQELRQEYLDELQAVRADLQLSDLAKAEQITELWQLTNAALATAYTDLQERRQARFAYLEAGLPIGPNIPAHASPADVTVMQQAFRAALSEARQATTEELQPTFDDASKFGDETVARAVLTTLIERGRLDLVRSWWADANGVSEELDEAAELMDGFGAWSLHVRNAFAPLEKPTETWQLPTLHAAADASVRALNQSRGAGQRAQALRQSSPYYVL